MRICHALVYLALTIGWCPSFQGAERDHASLQQQAAERLEAFKKLTAQAAEDGLDVSREKITITTAELFLKFADWDAQHPNELQSAIGAWWRVREQAEQISEELPGRELRDVLDMLDAASRELAAVRQRPSSRRAIPNMQSSSLLLSDGYYHAEGRPRFLSNFVWMPSEDKKLAEAYGDIGGTFIFPPNLLHDGTAKIRLQSRGSEASMGYVFLGHSQMPKWVLEKHPEITVGSRHFTAYDIDHPTTREVWRSLLAESVPQFTGQPVSQSGYLLANEPHWFSASGEWDTGPVSAHTQAKFRDWLKQKHGTIADLNGLWGTQYASIADVAVEIPIDIELQGTAIWNDWCRFNMARVTDWFRFLKTEIQRHDPSAKVHIKLIPGHFSQGKRSHGLDFETLVRLQEIIGCDAKITNSPNKVEQDGWSDRYACNWRDLAMPYDFFRSVSPDKLLFDSEFHGLSTVHWRDPDMSPEYVRCIYWLAHLHGMGMNQTWYWSREADGAPTKNSESGFYASNLTMPRVMNAFGRTMKELNAFAPEVVSLATAPKNVRLFYSETAAIQDAAYMDRMHDAYRSLYHHGLPLGFVTGQMLGEASEEELRAWPVVVVPEASQITIDELKALSRYHAQNGTLVVIGKDCLRNDQYGRPHVVQLSEASKLIRVAEQSDPIVKSTVATALRDRGLLTPVRLRESNSVGGPGCVWRTSPGRDGHLLLALNLGKTEAQITVTGTTRCHDMLTNSPHPVSFVLAPFGVKLLHARSVP